MHESHQTIPNETQSTHIPNANVTNMKLVAQF